MLGTSHEFRKEREREKFKTRGTYEGNEIVSYPTFPVCLSVCLYVCLSACLGHAVSYVELVAMGRYIVARQAEKGQ